MVSGASHPCQDTTLPWTVLVHLLTVLYSWHGSIMVTVGLVLDIWSDLLTIACGEHLGAH
jgi:hypothetical protein